LNIRAATPEDIPFIIELERVSPTAAHWSEPQYQQAVSQTDSSDRIALLAETPAGISASDQTLLPCCIIGFLVARRVGPEWELENIVVASQARGRGLGKRLLDALIVHAKNLDGVSVLLEVRESNTAARRLYEKAGFRQNARRASYYKEPTEDAILYVLALNALE